MLLYPLIACTAELIGGFNAEGVEFFGISFANAPDVVYGYGVEDAVAARVSDEIEYTSLITFGEFVGNFGQGFGLANAYGDRNAGPLVNRVADFVTVFCVVAGVGKDEKRFVNGVGFDAIGEVA